MKKLFILAMMLMMGAAGYAADNDKDTLVMFRSGQGVGSFDIKYVPATGETRSIKMRLLDAYTLQPLQEKMEDLDESDLQAQPHGRGLVRLLRNPGRVNLGAHEINEDGTFEVDGLEPTYFDEATQQLKNTYCITAASSNYGYIAVPFYSNVENGNIECEILFKRTTDIFDVNCDRQVNVTDVTTLVNMILEVVPKRVVLGDVDKNGRVNVSDITALINHILGNE
jgi:hypothetical protein